MNSNIKPKVEGNKIHISDQCSVFPSTFGFMLLFIKIVRLTSFSEQNKKPNWKLFWFSKQNENLKYCQKFSPNLFNSFYFCLIRKGS